MTELKPAPPRLEAVSDGIYAYIQPDGSWWINNMGVLVGERHTVVIDSTSTVRRNQHFFGELTQLSERPVTTLINTHHHGDHTNGNFLFETATIVAHEKCRAQIIADGKAGIQRLQQAGIWKDPDGPGPEWGDIEPAPPFLTYTEGVDVWVDDLKCEVRHFGTPAQTTNDSIIWIPERRLMFAGDLIFAEGTPFLLMGSVTGAIQAVSRLKDYDIETLVPGHGPVSGPGAIDDVLAYLRFVDELSREGYAAGVPPLELAQRTDLGQFASLSDSERIVGNLHRAYAELAGAPRGAEIDAMAAISDMITYNGGKPLTCLA